jgi:glyceraldehyde 3-phosphate dehydrogenase
MKRIKVGINGLGRIGRNLCRVIVRDLNDRFEIIAVNDVVPAATLVQSLRRDSTHGRFPVEVEPLGEDAIRLADHRVAVSSEKDAERIPWGEYGVELVFECSGFYLTREKASAHIRAGATKVIISAPPKDDTPIIVMGVNDDTLTAGMTIVSNASCTTNCLAPIAKALDSSIGVICGLTSTTHAVTSGQQVVDSFGNERARSALNNIIPTTTGAAKAVAPTIPHLKGKLGGSSLRVPVTDVSVVEAVFVVAGAHDAGSVREALAAEAAKQNKRSLTGMILYIGEEYQVSSDAIGSPWSSMVLANKVMAIPFDGGTLVKITAFYDNEIGYSYRMADLALAMMKTA